MKPDGTLETRYRLWEATTEDMAIIKTYSEISGISIGVLFNSPHMDTNISGYWNYFLERPNYAGWYSIDRFLLKELKKMKFINLTYKYKKEKKKCDAEAVTIS